LEIELMKTIYLSLVVLVGLSAVAVAQTQPAAAPTNEELIKQLTGWATPPARDAAQLVDAYGKAIDYLMPLMSAEDVSSRYNYQILLQDMGSWASRPGAEAERLAMSKAMVTALEQRKMDNTLRNWFILQLQRVGKAESVPVLVKLLSDDDKNTRDYARRALEKNPDASATDALLKELAGAKDAGWKMGLINALGTRRAQSAVKPLTAALSDSDPNVAKTAVMALSRIGGSDSVQALSAVLAKPTGPISTKAAQCLIDMAAQMAKDNDKAGAAKLCASVYEWANKATATPDSPVPISIRMGAATGLIVNDADRGAKEVVTLVQDDNPKIRAAAVQAARQSTSDAPAKALVGTLAKLGSDSQVQVLGLIADRKYTSAESAVIAALGGKDEAVSVAAADTLSRLGTETGAKALFDSAVNARGNVQKAAQSGLATMASAQTDALIKTKAASGDPNSRAVAINLLGQRRSEGAGKLLTTYATDADDTVSAAAFQAMVNMADAMDLAALADLVVKAKSEETRAAGVTALKAVLAKAQDKEAAGKIIIDRMNKAEGETKLTFLASLTAVPSATALKAVTDAARSSDEKTRDKGIRTLCEWPDYEAVPALVDIALNPQTALNHHVLAAQAALNLIAPQQQGMGMGMGQRGGQRGGRGMGQPADTAQIESKAVLCLKIFDQARRIEEKRTAVSALAYLPCDRSTNRLLELVKDETLKNEAALAAVTLAGNMLRSNQQAAQDLAKKILDMNISPDINSRANAVIAGNARGMRMGGMGGAGGGRGGARGQ
jgi:HEAT repeat protein